MHGTLGSIPDPILWLGGGMSPTKRLITLVTVPSILSQAQHYHTVSLHHPSTVTGGRAGGGRHAEEPADGDADVLRIPDVRLREDPDAAPGRPHAPPRAAVVGGRHGHHPGPRCARHKDGW